ncbi:acyl-CoA thioesterase [Marixanthomonas spongiae]|uniref:Acyl-CoA thioesterase FadM n=1 Tax=Marixanthomonas spongiae TaxID=2174845 RepID=A0A2U0I5X7_9FLAO|nr:acyl-CoA thioesterase [Marixanthomonas spongiae]PVW16499.1 hypothetical protein DDV96_04405 [Marixanthomonas spongiae]
MIYYWLHLIYLYIGARFFWSKVDITSNQVNHRRVSLFDCDALKYMANSRYFYYMDFIRFEKLFRSKLYENSFKKGMYPVFGAQKIIYKKPLKRWTAFTVTLMLEGWDEKWYYHKHIFSNKNGICAIGYTKAAFWKNHKLQDLAPIFKNCGMTETEKKIPSEIVHLFENDQQLLKHKIKNNSK